MKDAMLWKRILREGLNGPDEKIAHEIVKAPIIVDRLPVLHREGTCDWWQYNNLAFPFETFWIEHPATPVGATLSGMLFEVIAEDAGFRVGVVSVFAVPGCKPHVATVASFNADRSGTLVLNEEKGLPLTQLLMPPKLSAIDNRIVMNGFMGALSDAMDVLLLLGCKNVSLKPEFNDANDVARATKRHGPTAHGYRYHVLVVRPPGARADAPAQEIGVMPRHVCRGHFAEYGPDFNKGLLFGKYAGRFYVPPHLKGDAKNGTVEKDYAVHV